MTQEHILLNKPWLRPIHILNISERLSKTTKNNAFLVYNLKLNQYELHTKEAYLLSGDSYNSPIDKECLNGFICYDYRANDNKLFLTEIMSERDNRTFAFDKREKRIEDNSSLYKIIERTLGTTI